MLAIRVGASPGTPMMMGLANSTSKGSLRSLRHLITQLLEDPECRMWFSTPVPLDQYPTYREIIKRPCDLGTIQRRLHPLGGAKFPYHESSASTAYEDIRRVFTNAMLFTPDVTTSVHRAAVRLLKIVDAHPAPLPLPATPTITSPPATTPEAKQVRNCDEETRAKQKAERSRAAAYDQGLTLENRARIIREVRAREAALPDALNEKIKACKDIAFGRAPKPLPSLPIPKPYPEELLWHKQGTPFPSTDGTPWKGVGMGEEEGGGNGEKGGWGPWS